MDWLALVLEQIDRDFHVAAATIIWIVLIAVPAILGARDLVRDITDRVRNPVAWWWELPRVLAHGLATLAFMALTCLPFIVAIDSARIA